MLREWFPKRVLPAEEAREAVSRFLARAAKNWFLDVESTHRVSLNGTDEQPYSIQTRYQRLDVFQSPGYGLRMVLDGRVQLAQSDEWIYHELLVHPACVVHGSPQRALVLGGGDGCAVRELLKYPRLQDITLVDIDEEVVAAFRDRFSRINGGALEDPRVRVICEDALEHLRRQGGHYDLIISDLTEPFDLTDLAGELSFHLYTPSFYGMIQDRLTPDGIFVCQTGGVIYQTEHDAHHFSLLTDIRCRFPHVRTCYEFVPSFEELWSITLASQRPLDISGARVDEILRRLGLEPLRYYDGTSHERAFAAPLFIRGHWERSPQ